MQLAFTATAAAHWIGLGSWVDAARTARPLRSSRPSRTSKPQVRTAGPAAELLRDLPRGNTLAVMQPLGLEVVCLKGTLWITHDGDLLDHIVESGCCYTAKRGEKMHVYALADARFIVEPNDD